MPFCSGEGACHNARTVYLKIQKKRLKIHVCMYIDIEYVIEEAKFSKK